MAYNSKFTGAQIDALLDASEAMKTSKEDVANKVTTLGADATDTQYPSAKAVWDAISSIATTDEINKIYRAEWVTDLYYDYSGVANNASGYFGTNLMLVKPGDIVRFNIKTSIYNISCAFFQQGTFIKELYDGDVITENGCVAFSYLSSSQQGDVSAYILRGYSEEIENVEENQNIGLNLLYDIQREMYNSVNEDLKPLFPSTQTKVAYTIYGSKATADGYTNIIVDITDDILGFKVTLAAIKTTIPVFVFLDGNENPLGYNNTNTQITDVEIYKDSFPIGTKKISIQVGKNVPLLDQYKISVLKTGSSKFNENENGNENVTLDFKSFSELFNSYQKMNLKICFSGDSNTYGYGLSDIQNSWANLIKNILNTKDWYYFTPVLYMSEKCKRELNAEIKGNYGQYVGGLNLNSASAEFIFTTDSKEVVISAENFSWAGKVAIDNVDTYTDVAQWNNTNISVGDGNYHTYRFYGRTAGQVVLNAIRLKKILLVDNKAATGSGYHTPNIYPNAEEYDWFVIMIGTNNRAAYGQYCGSIKAKNYENKGTFIYPIPAYNSGVAAYEKATEAYNMVKSFFSEYGYEIITPDYELLKSQDARSLYYSDDLHINEQGHIYVAKLISNKLGIGDILYQNNN